jgi:undecaprenyl pyrophosphate synthase
MVADVWYRRPSSSGCRYEQSIGLAEVVLFVVESRDYRRVPQCFEILELSIQPRVSVQCVHAGGSKSQALGSSEMLLKHVPRLLTRQTDPQEQ